MVRSRTFPIVRSCVLLTFVAIVGATSADAGRIATLDDGQKLIINDDGTWKYATTREAFGAPPQRPLVQEKTDTRTQPITTSKDISTIVDELKTNTAFDFRNVRWGMSLAQVKQAERLKLLQEGAELLNYDFTLIGMNCTISYNFTAGKLSSARYAIQQKHHDPALFSEDFIALKKHLSLLYGAPMAVEDTWKNDQFKMEEPKWGFAVSLGFLARSVSWKNGKTDTVLRMQGQNHEIFITIEYAGRIKNSGST